MTEPTETLRPVVPSDAHQAESRPVFDATEPGPDEPLDAAELREIEQFAWEFSDVNGNVLLAASDVVRLARQASRLQAELERTEGDLAVAIREAIAARGSVAAANQRAERLAERIVSARRELLRGGQTASIRANAALRALDGAS